MRLGFVFASAFVVAAAVAPDHDRPLAPPAPVGGLSAPPSRPATPEPPAAAPPAAAPEVPVPLARAGLAPVPPVVPARPRPPAAKPARPAPPAVPPLDLAALGLADPDKPGAPPKGDLRPPAPAGPAPDLKIVQARLDLEALAPPKNPFPNTKVEPLDLAALGLSGDRPKETPKVAPDERPKGPPNAPVRGGP